MRRPSGWTDQQRIDVAIGAVISIGKGCSFADIFAFWRAASTGKGL